LSASAKGRVRTSDRTDAFILGTLRDTRVAVCPLEPEIAADAVELPSWNHRDPADRIIVATARFKSGVLVTRDGDILDYARDVCAVRAWEPGAAREVECKKRGR